MKDLNQEFAELCGICWHVTTVHPGTDCMGPLLTCSCGAEGWPEPCTNPNFKADPRLVLGGMMKIGKFVEFINYLFKDYIFAVGAAVTLAEYMMDTTGLFLKKAMEFLEGKKVC